MSKLNKHRHETSWASGVRIREASKVGIVSKMSDVQMCKVSKISEPTVVQGGCGGRWMGS